MQAKLKLQIIAILPFMNILPYNGSETPSPFILDAVPACYAFLNPNRCVCVHMRFVCIHKSLFLHRRKHEESEVKPEHINPQRMSVNLH